MTPGEQFLAMLSARVRRFPRKRIVFPEHSDERVQEAAARLRGEGLADPVVPAADDRLWPLYYQRRQHRGISEAEARRIAAHPLYCAALMVTAGEADGFVGGAANTTAGTVRAALHCIGPAPGIETISSFFVVAARERTFGHEGLLLFADCAVVVEPTAEQLAGIAIATAQNTRTILGVEPKVALLSFSTRGSAAHPCVTRVAEAAQLARKRAPLLRIDGELQADAALVPSVCLAKASGSVVAGEANTLIFPDLASGNIAVKLVERLGGAATAGPILQGLAKPANDLSRGCSAEGVYAVALITALQSEESFAAV